MPFYPDLQQFILDSTWEINPIVKAYKNRPKKMGFVIDNILKLKKGCREGKQGVGKIPPRTVTETFLLATWNLREFDANAKKNGPRLEESFYYIAEIISCFDLVAIQEIREDLRPLKKLKRILGPQWDYMVTDVTEGRSGNQERIAFIYDTGKVRFNNIVGEIVLPGTAKKPATQFARSPFLVSFQAGWLKINLCSVHIYFGSETKKERRIKEIGDLSTLLGKRAAKDFENYVVLGDFNITNPQDATMKALLKGKFNIPKPLQNYEKGSNLAQDKYYDQIAYRNTYKTIEFTGNAGVFNYYEYVFRDDQMNDYLEDYNLLMVQNGKKPVKKLTPKTFKTWKTFQMSDHMPLWCEFKIDFSEDYLKFLKRKPYIKRKDDAKRDK